MARLSLQPFSVLRFFPGLVRIACLALAATSCVTPDRPGGPLAVRNQHPVQLTALRMPPSSARTMAAGGLEVGVNTSYSSLFLNGEEGTNAYRMDGEILRAGLLARYALTRGLELRIEIPVAHSGGGFLDGFVEDYHHTFGLENGRRSLAPQGRFEIQAVHDGSLAYQMERRSASLLDLPIEVMWRFFEHRGSIDLDLAVRSAVELPTGDQQAGYGNGGFDYAVGVVGEIAMGPVAFSTHFAHTTVATPDRARRARLEYTDCISSGIGLEVAMTADLAALVQLEMDQTVLRELYNVHTESDQWILWVGVRGRFANGVLFELAFGEDLTLNASPDFTVFFGLRAQFGLPR